MTSDELYSCQRCDSFLRVAEFKALPRLRAAHRLSVAMSGLRWTPARVVHHNGAPVEIVVPLEGPGVALELRVTRDLVELFQRPLTIDGQRLRPDPSALRLFSASARMDLLALAARPRTPLAEFLVAAMRRALKPRPLRCRAPYDQAVEALGLLAALAGHPVTLEAATPFLPSGITPPLEDPALAALGRGLAAALQAHGWDVPGHGDGCGVLVARSLRSGDPARLASAHARAAALARLEAIIRATRGSRRWHAYANTA